MIRVFQLKSANVKVADLDGDQMPITANYYIDVPADKIDPKTGKNISELVHSQILKRLKIYDDNLLEGFQQSILMTCFNENPNDILNGKIRNNDLTLKNIKVKETDIIETDVVCSLENGLVVGKRTLVKIVPFCNIYVPIEYFTEVTNTNVDDTYCPETFITDEMLDHRIENMSAFKERVKFYRDINPVYVAKSIQNSIYEFLYNEYYTFNFAILHEIRRIYTATSTGLIMIKVIPVNEKTFNVELIVNRPGLIIGKSGYLIEAFRKYIQDMVQYSMIDDNIKIDVSITEFNKRQIWREGLRADSVFMF